MRGFSAPVIPDNAMRHPGYLAVIFRYRMVGMSTYPPYRARACRWAASVVAWMKRSGIQGTVPRHPVFRYAFIRASNYISDFPTEEDANI